MSTTAQSGFRDLAGMIAYMDTQCTKINALVTEIEEIQREFETNFVRAQQQFENARTAAVAWVEARDWRSPQWLVDAVDKRLPEVREAKRQRLEALRTEIAQLEEQRQGIEKQNEAAMAAFKESNPQLNAREEELKQLELEQRDRFYKLQADWHKAAGGLGWLVRPGAVRKAREAMELANQQWVNTNERLAEVRNSWVAIKQKTDETETTLQSAWRLRTAEIARLRRELGTLEADLEAASRDQAALDVLSAVAAVPDSDQPQFDALLAQVVALNDEHRAYEAGIAQVAELMGVTRGICEGLTRMRESVDGVKKEQDMHSELARLTLRAPVEALRFHDLWDQLAPLVRDEKKAAQHPAQFAGHVRQAIGERLSKDAIDVMFTQLGEELNRATKEQWG